MDKYVTVSLPIAIAKAMDELIGEVGYWPSRGAFVREAVLEKIRLERQRLKEVSGLSGTDASINAGSKTPPGD